MLATLPDACFPRTDEEEVLVRLVIFISPRLALLTRDAAPGPAGGLVALPPLRPAESNLAPPPPPPPPTPPPEPIAMATEPVAAAAAAAAPPDVAPLPMRYPPIVDMLLRRPLLSSLVAFALLVRVADGRGAVVVVVVVVIAEGTECLEDLFPEAPPPPLDCEVRAAADAPPTECRA